MKNLIRRFLSLTHRTERNEYRIQSILSVLHGFNLQIYLFVFSAFFFPVIAIQSEGFDPTSPLAVKKAPGSAVPIYQLVEIALMGPDSVGMGVPNPFLINVDVTFAGPEGQNIIIPGFYDGDGMGGMNGKVWKVRFTPDAAGTWTYQSSSPEPLLNGQSGTFEVEEASPCPEYVAGGLPDFTCQGQIKYDGSYYLRFSDGSYWIKGGIDDPENFLGKSLGDWAGKKSAVDYLASQSANSIYVITNNIDGDGKDTWPWVGTTPQSAKINTTRFNVQKLHLWEDFFSYVQEKGIVLHLVLSDDGAWDGFDHALYYREMIARFGHHPGLIWNIGEEANDTYTEQEQIDLAEMIHDLDPFDHPVTVHRNAPWPFLGHPRFDLTSIQPIDGSKNFTTTKLGDQNGVVITHREGGAAAGWPIPVMIDELPRVTLVNEATRIKMRAEVLYPIFFGGGNFELHYYDAYSQRGTIALEDLAPMLDDMARARGFIERLDFWQMNPLNSLLLQGTGFVFANPGTTYGVYLPAGGDMQIDLSDYTETFEAQWFDPRTGDFLPVGSVQGGGPADFSSPDSQDWVLLLEAYTMTETSTPWVTDTPTGTSTASPVYTETPEMTGTSTPTQTYSPDLTETPTPTGTPGTTDTPPPTPTDTATSTPPETVTLTPTPTITPGVTDTQVPTPTDTATSTPPYTDTPTPTQTPTLTVEPTPAPMILLADDFNRPDSAILGGGWVETEGTGAAVGISGNRLCLTDTSDVTNRPIALRTFQQVSFGQVLWNFDFDWTRLGKEVGYKLFMQLGEGGLMSDISQGAGVGVNLVWTKLGNTHQTLAYREGSIETSLTVLSGATTITILADLTDKEYQITIGNALIQSGIPFDKLVNLDTVRFFTDGLNEQYFSGRCFDDLQIEIAGPD